MIPAVLARQLQQTVLDYLETTLSLADTDFEARLHAFLAGEDGLFRGPFIDVRLPYRLATTDPRVFLEYAPPFTPYEHQVNAFERLSSLHGRQPQHTLVTTGTGSGKTECFLYPILDHCLRHRDEPGIKALLLYPMNALATDQARRLAKLLHGDPRLRGVSAGVYIGGDGRHGVSDAAHLVDRRDVLRQSPPDILLTNYKMLDFLLMRPDDRGLWQRNTPDTLRYLVLDELHTYDGAQGSDVACLIRRLRSRLGIRAGSMCFVGTSATLGDRDDARATATLADFASLLAGEPIGTNAILREDRHTVAEALDVEVDLTAMPGASDDARLDPERAETVDAWLAAQCALWLGAPALPPVEVGARLKRHAFLRSLLRALEGRVQPWDRLSESLARVEPALAELDDAQRWRVVQSFLGLVSFARVADGTGERPLLATRVQLWVRELRRLMRVVDPAAINFAWHDRLAAQTPDRWLPIAHCRECGVSGWAAQQREGEDVLRGDVREVGKAWLRRDVGARFVLPGADPTQLVPDTWLCPRCLRVGTSNGCPCGAERFAVRISREAAPQPPRRWLERCPSCGTDGALSILGSRAPSLGSVVITQLFLSPYNDDRKLLAFTDSVQDASHHASFFGARTWRFSVRAAIQSALEDGADAPTLRELTARLLERANVVTDPRARIERWLPTDLRDLSEALQYRDKPTDAGRQGRLWERLVTRLTWEVVQEYGLAARTGGRTLERTGCSTAFADEARVQAAVDALVDDVRERSLVGPRSGEVDPADLRHLVDALLDRLRVRGGIFHPLLDEYVRREGNRFILNKRIQPLLSPFARGARAPRFLQGTLHCDPFDSWGHTAGAEPSWYRDMALRVLRLPDAHVDSTALYRQAMARLTQHGALEERSSGNVPVWGFSSDALRATREVATVLCDRCGDRTPLAAAVAHRMAGRACLHFRCEGRLAFAGDATERYYARVYRSGSVQRIFPAEHTGLLDRATRESLEDRFKDGTEPGAPNLLVCTPTLEMGIDVGDLSAVMTCSVPPTTSNHVQRVGRAGRTTGNALAVGLVLSRAHDQYFFDDPLEMIAGAVDPPGMFLDAPEVLWRQFVAFVMDRWARDDASIDAIPRMASEVLGSQRERFLGGLARYYDGHREALIGDFLAMFERRVTSVPQVSRESEDWLRERARAVSPIDAVNAAFDALADEIRELENLRERLRRHRDRLAEQPVDSPALEEERSEVDEGLAVIARTLDDLRKKYPLNVLTDAGVLPNYAFPEPGVTLRAVVEQDRDPASRAAKPVDGAKPKRKVQRWETHEYLRPASSALREFAPFNTFYAEGRRLRITDVDLGSAQRPLVGPWRFCAACHHTETTAPTEVAPLCPRCRAPGWDDQGQRREVVRFRLAGSITRQHESLTVDDRDDREETSYVVSDLIDVGPEHWRGARASTSPLFGVELLHDLVLREINFGPERARDDTARVADREVPARGFVVCRDCGRVQEGDGAKADHAIHCPRRRGQGSGDGLVSVWLSREVKSEAIRLLLPASTVAVDEARSSFRAALLLGLRRKFKGRPGHLLLKASSEPVVGRGDARRTFLVLYDAVPGGTGYLRDLWRTDGLRECMRLALDVLERCRCRSDPDRDGCYRCLLGYHTSHESVQPSRRRAAELLRESLAAWEVMEEVPTLSEVSVDTLLESELERRFVRALKAHVESSGGAWQAALHAGKAECARFTLGEVPWLLEPQVDVEVSTGVARKCRPDFVLWCQRDDGTLPVAVFCDGFEFHANPEEPRGRIHDDLDKRGALLASDRWRVWSVTWNDLDAFEASGPQDPAPSVFAAITPVSIEPVAKRLGSSLRRDLHLLDSMRALVTWLRDLDDAGWTAFARALLLASMTSKTQPTAEALDDAEGALWKAPARFDAPALDVAKGTPTWLGALRAEGWWMLLARVPTAAVQSQRWGDMRAVLRLFDEHTARSQEGFRASWRAALLAWNLLQFHGAVSVISSEQDRVPLSASIEEVSPRVSQVPSYDEALREVLELVDPSCEALVRALFARGIARPSIGDDVTHRGRVVATAELVWSTEKVAVVVDAESGRGCEAAGWTVLAPDVDVSALEAALRSGSSVT